jgi:hypothetical protein
MNRTLRGWAHELSVKGCHREGFADLPLACFLSRNDTHAWFYCGHRAGFQMILPSSLVISSEMGAD